MPIDFLCGQCQHTLRVPDESAGKKARCPQCGNVQQIPVPPSASNAGFDLGQFDQPMPGPSNAPASPSPSPWDSAPGKPSGEYGPLPTSQPSNQDQPYQSYPGASAPYGGYYVRQPKTLQQVQDRVRPPAIALIVVAVLSLLCAGLMVAAGGIGLAEGDEDAIPIIVIAVIGGIMQLGIIIGAARMLFLKNYGLAITAAVLSLASGLCCQLLMPFGIWALVILCDADTRARFS